MERLTQTSFPLPPGTFKFCQLCGYTSEHDDICEFTMLRECDDNDEPEENSVLFRCNSDKCVKAIEDHERLYYTVEWGRGGPGKFMLVCEDCEFRKPDFSCGAPELKANGGEGMEVIFSNLPVFHVHVCFSDGRSFNGNAMPKPVVECKSKRKLPVVTT
jgi:hypothetical protein